MTFRKSYLRNVISLNIAFSILIGGTLCAKAEKNVIEEIPVSHAVTRTVVGLKTNLLYDALLSPNLGVEVGLSRKFTLDVSGNLNLWPIDHHTWKHWQVQPELRYWLCEGFSGHFFGIETHVGQFNMGNINFGLNFLGTDFGLLKDNRFQGWQGGAGLTYGYAWVVAQHWNVEAEIGIGYSYVKYDQYPCADCGTKSKSGAHHNYFGLTKAQVGLVYVF